MTIPKNCTFLFLLLCVVFWLLFSFPVAAQPEYTITETELEQLEITLQSLRKSSQTQERQIYGLNMSLKKAQKQVASLKTALQKAQKLQQNLTAQLEAEKQTSTALRKSYTTYEREQDALLSEKQKKIDMLTAKLYRRTIFLTLAICLLVIIGIIPLVKLYLKGKLKIPFP